MRALWRDQVVAEAPEDDLVQIEGNWYFPPGGVNRALLVESPTPYTCQWKGACQYFTLRAGDDEAVDAAWCYPDLLPGAAERVGTDFTGYMTFGPAVSVL